MPLNELLQRQPVRWHGVKLNAPDWSHQSHTAAATVPLLGYMLHLIINAYWEPLQFEILALGAQQF
jgi:glycogen operon protein